MRRPGAAAGPEIPDSSLLIAGSRPTERVGTSAIDRAKFIRVY